MYQNDYVTKGVAMKQAIMYSRVSSEEQAKGDAVSLDQQEADMRALAERNGWQIATHLVDCKNYKATQPPKKGKIINPSGERADRPQFLELLELIRSGKYDVVLCWRDDRLMRHPRVAVALEDALDMGDANRSGKGPVEVYEANGATVDRMMMHMKAIIWREENKRRTERMKMAKKGTLQDGRWPGNYSRFGYTSKREPGRRGRQIELGDPEQVDIVKSIFDWYDAGLSGREIRKLLLARGAEQYGHKRKRDWCTTVINQILRAEDYCGLATWEFDDGGLSIEIPAIISREQWERVQTRLDNARRLSTRNAYGIYLLQNIARCGECGGKISSSLKRYHYWSLADGTRKRVVLDPPQFRYRCVIAQAYNDEDHPHPYSFKGDDLEWHIWRHIVDYGIKQPDIIRGQVETRQKELIAQGESVNGDIAHVRGNIEEVQGERVFYQRQAARGKIDEPEFDERMTETDDKRQYWQAELERLQELRDDSSSVQAGLNYANELLETIHNVLDEIDVPPEFLSQCPEGERRHILGARQKIIRALCDTIYIYADGRVKIEGVIDGSEAPQFNLVNTRNQCRRLKNKAHHRPAP